MIPALWTRYFCLILVTAALFLAAVLLTRMDKLTDNVYTSSWSAAVTWITTS